MKKEKRLDSLKHEESIYKECGHRVGYKCCCHYNYTAEHSFDLVDEMNLSHRRLRLK